MDPRDLYQQVILDHNQRPKNFKKLPDATHTAVGFNPLCGDKIAVFLDVVNGVIRDVGFQGMGCAISNASASMMTAAVKGKTVAEAEDLFAGFHEMVTGNTAAEPDGRALGKLAAFAGVTEFPARVKCASLSWHTLLAALRNEVKTVVTE